MRLYNFTYCFLITLLLVSCSEDEELTQREEDLLEFNVFRGDSDFFSFGTVGEVPFRVIVTGAEGEVLANKTIPKNITTSFSINFNNSADYMVHFAYRENFEDFTGFQAVRYRISSFINPRVSDYTINGDSQESAFGLYSQESNTSVNIINAGEPLQFIGSSFGTSFNSSSGLGDFITLSLPQSFSNKILIRAKKENEENTRYHLTPNLMAGSNLDVDFNQMSPSLSHFITSSNVVNIQGRNLNNINTSYILPKFEDPDNQNISNFNIPIGVFDDFIVHTSSEFEVSNGTEERYNRTAYSSIENLPTSEITIPFLTASSQSNLINNFAMQTEGTYDFFRVFFSYAEPQLPDETNNDIFWSIIGDASSAVNFEVPDILSLVINPEDNFSLTLTDLEGGDPFLYNSTEINSTQDYINLITNRQQSPGFSAITNNTFRLRLND